MAEIAGTETLTAFAPVRFSREQARKTLPRILADHEILCFIAEGSYGEVWLSRNLHTGHFHAIKFIWKTGGGDHATNRELLALRRFEPISRTHPGFVQILHVGELPNAFYYIMQVADDARTGQAINPADYKPRLLHRTRLSASECVRIGTSLTEAICALHAEGLLHRDIKPSNIIYVNGTPKLADIGLIADIDGCRSFVGTDGFVPPEGPTSYQSDIYSLGKLLYEISTGLDRHEFPALPEDVADEPLLLELNAIILRACDPDPTRRHHSARELGEELTALEAGRSIQRLRQLERYLQRAKKIAALLTLGTLIGFGAYSYEQARERQASEILQRRIGGITSKGTESLKRGDYADALRSFLQLAREDPGNLMDHRLRIASTYNSTILPVKRWHSSRGTGALSRDGQSLATSDGQTIRLFDPLTGQLLREWNRPADRLALSPNSSILAFSEDGNVTIENLDTGISRAAAFDEDIIFLAVDDSGNLAVTFNNRVQLLKPTGESQTFSFTGVPFMTFLSPSSRVLATGLFSGELIMWDLGTGQRLPWTPAHNRVFYTALFSQDEEILITTSEDRTAIAWDFTTGEKIDYVSHDDGITAAAWVPGLELLATTGLDRTVRLWSDRHYQPLRENHILRQPDRIVGAAFREPHYLITVSDGGTVTAWNLFPPRPAPKELAEPVEIPSKRRIETEKVRLSASERSLQGRIGSRNIAFEAGSQIETVAIHPTHLGFAVGTSDSQFLAHSVQLFSPGGDPLPIQLRHDDGILFVAFSPDGEKIVTCSEDFTARLWNFRTGEPISPPLRHRHQVRWAAFNDSGTWLATVSWDEKLIIWETSNGDPLTPPIAFHDPLEYVAFHGQTGIIAANHKRSYHLTLPLLEPSELDPEVLKFLEQ